MTMAHLENTSCHNIRCLTILPWILGYHADKFIFSSFFRKFDKFKYEVRSRKLIQNACIYMVFMTGVKIK